MHRRRLYPPNYTDIPDAEGLPAEARQQEQQRCRRGAAVVEINNEPISRGDERI